MTSSSAGSSPAAHDDDSGLDDASATSSPSSPSLRSLLLGGSPNVWRTILFTCLVNLTGSIWQVTVWSPLLKALFHSNIRLGYVAAASGIGELAAALVSGWGADRLGKERFLRVAAVVGMLASGAVAAGVHWEHFATLVIASFASGAAYGAFFPAVEGIFADSVPEGERTFIYNVKYGLESTSYALAFAVTLCLFAGFGDEWHVPTMKLVVYVGITGSFFVSWLLFTIREKYTLRNMASSEAYDGLLINEAHGDKQNDDNAKDEDAQAALAAEEAAQFDRLMAVLSQYAPGLLPQWAVPFAVAIKDVVMCFGSGMTVMYISLYLIDDYSVSPMALQGIFIVGSMSSVSLSQLAAAVVGDSGKCATADGKPRFNRVRVMLVFIGIGVVGIFYLALVKTGPMATLWPILVVYTLRYGAVNALSGLSRSVLMDMVPARNRAKWNVFESVSSASWAGSAIIGGAIADKWDYRASFLITAACHTLTWIITASAALNRDRPPREVLESLVDEGVIPVSDRDAALDGDASSSPDSSGAQHAP